MRKLIAGMLAIGMLFCSLTGCAQKQEEAVVQETSQNPEAEGENEQHLIGVITYDFTDGEVIGFRNYLENYISQCFSDVDFLYASELTSPEDEKVLLEDMKEAGVDGILSFISYDLADTVNYCAENDIYYMMASGTISEDEYAKVAENPYFVGVIGPGEKMEYAAGKKLAKNYTNKLLGDTYFVLSGGAYIGNAMQGL